VSPLPDAPAGLTRGVLTPPPGKKLKKRLEDLERRAASNSASPEQKPAELAAPSRDDARSKSTSPRKNSGIRRHTPDVPQSSYFSTQDERAAMFTHQYTRQLSTSPPPFSYSTYSSAEPTAYSYAQSSPNYGWATTGPEMPSYPTNYLPPLASTYSLPSNEPAMKQQPPPHAQHPQPPNYYGDEEVSPFSMSYASMAGIDIQQTHQYQDSNIHVRAQQNCKSQRQRPRLPRSPR
jgi:hypothetical protein